MLLLQLRASATTRWKTARWHTRLGNKAQHWIALGPTRWVAHSTEVGSTNEERGRVRRSRSIRPAPQARSRVAFVVKPGGEIRTLMTSPYGSQPLATVTTTTTINELRQSGATFPKSVTEPPGCASVSIRNQAMHFRYRAFEKIAIAPESWLDLTRMQKASSSRGRAASPESRQQGCIDRQAIGSCLLPMQRTIERTHISYICR